MSRRTLENAYELRNSGLCRRKNLRRPLDFASGSRSHLRSLARLSGRGHAHDEPEFPNATGRLSAPCRARPVDRLPCPRSAVPVRGEAGQAILRPSLFNFGPLPLVLLWRPSSKEVHATPSPHAPMPSAQRRTALSSPSQWWTRSPGEACRTEEIPSWSEAAELADRSVSDPRASRTRRGWSAHQSGGRSKPRL